MRLIITNCAFIIISCARRGVFVGYSLISLALRAQSSHPASGCGISCMRKTTEARVAITNHRENTGRYLPHSRVLMSVITGQ